MMRRIWFVGIMVLIFFMVCPVHKTQALSASFYPGNLKKNTTETDPNNGLGNLEISGGKNGNIVIKDKGTEHSVKNQVNDMFNHANVMSTGITGVLALICLVYFMVNIVQFAGSGLSGQAGKKWMALIKILTSGLGAMLLGGYFVYAIFVYGLLR